MLEATIASIEATVNRPRHLFIATRDSSTNRVPDSVSHPLVASDNQRLYARLFEHLQDGLLITDDTGRVIDMNPAVTALTGYSRADLLGHIPDFTARMQPPPVALRSTLEAPRPATTTWRCESVEKRRDGEPVALSLTSSSMPPAVAGESGLRAVVMSDITQARLQRDKLKWQSQFDELTGLPNRTRFMPILQRSMKDALSEGFRLTVCMLALDDFKLLAGRLGGALADELLVAWAGRLRKAVHRRTGADDAIARLAGDEFVLLIRSATSLEARHAVERLLQMLRQPYVLAGPQSTESMTAALPAPIDVVATASIGATIYPHDDVDADTLLRHADHALYGARQAGNGGCVFFDPVHDRRVKERLQAVAVIQDGFNADEFVLHYQPKVDMRLGRVLGVEALLRWRHPQRGLVSPGQFLPFIEHTDLGVDVGDWVLQRGIAQLTDWLALGLDITVSVNISARHLQQPTFVTRLAELLHAREPRVASRLVIEVLETTALEDVGYMRKLMHDCSALGVRFALDDFGTGYSTFTYLRQLPLDLLKIDQSFVRHMLDDRQDLAIVEGVIALSRKFGCGVIAEGVESQAHAERLIEAGCDIGQGNGIAMSMPADEVEAWVHDYHLGHAPHIRLRAAEEPVSVI